MPRFQRPADARSSDVEVVHFYNRNFATQVSDESNSCIVAYHWRSGFFSTLGNKLLYLACKGLPYTHVLDDHDFLEATDQYLSLVYGTKTPNPEDARRLTNTLRMYHREWDAHTILVTHSQGNLLVAQALDSLPATQGAPIEAGHCTADLSLASPIVRSEFGLDAHYLRGIDMNGDVLSIIGLLNDFPHIDSDISLLATSDLARLARSSPNNTLLLNRMFQWGKRIHAVDHNYFSAHPGRDSVTSMLAQLHDECTAGSITANPGSLTVPLGSRVPVSITVRSRTNNVLMGRPFQGSTNSWVLGDDSVVYGTAPSHGVSTGGVALGNGPQLGQLSVSVPSVSFPGRIVEHRTSQWIAVAGRSDTLGLIAPTPPGPTWDGTPSACNQTVRTTAAGGGWTDWEQVCHRRYTFDIPALALPIAAQFRIAYAGYPDGEFGPPSDAGWSALPSSEYSFDMDLDCGREYCFRAALIETRSVPYRGLITSDTTCFSDNCPASYSPPMISQRVAPHGRPGNSAPIHVDIPRGLSPIKKGGSHGRD
jgi:hypothetical protein